MVDLKAFRRKNNLLQKDLATYLGISREFISMVESGKAVLPRNHIGKLLNNDKGWDTSAIQEQESTGKKIPLYNDVATIGGNNEQVANVDDAARPTELVDAGDWFPTATSAIHHYGDSMVEYPSGCILALKRVNDPRLLINGENYVIETDEFRITKQLQDDGDFIMAYSSNRETYPDGRLIHSPIRIPKDAIRHLDLVLGCVIKRFSTPMNIR